MTLRLKRDPNARGVHCAPFKEYKSGFGISLDVQQQKVRSTSFYSTLMGIEL